MEHNLSDIVETLKTAKDSGRKCTLLIGAGCSVKAGIPTASEFVKLIEKEHPRAFEKAKDKTYSHCMAALAPGERRELITKYVDNAKINWAHVAIAQLLKLGFVDRVLTTNFDPLVVRACSLANLFPAVYDFASSQSFKPHYVPDQAIFYLHGQRSGFVLLNTPEECKKQANLLAPLFEDAGKGRVWIVVGYSGENDPVFEHLAKVDEFEYRLYWIGYKDNEPSTHVREKLLSEEKYAFFVKGFDADDFFVSLTQQLECFPPEFVSTPFSHLANLMGVLPPYKPPKQEAEYDVLEKPRWMIKQAVEKYEQSKVSDIRRAYMAGDYEKAITLFSKSDKPTEEIIYYIVWSYVEQGNILLGQAKTKSGEEADGLFEGAFKKYDEALKLKHDNYEALNNWGLALFHQAQKKEGEIAYHIYIEACKKYKAALELKSDVHQAYYNWGLALSALAGTKAKEEADNLYVEAYEKYDAALKIKPDKDIALSTWGNALSAQARTKSGEVADKLYSEACKKYEAALKIKPNKYNVLYNWGNIFFLQAQTKSGEEADKLYAEACRKYEAALKIKPDNYAVLYNLACLFALQNKEMECLSWLKRRLIIQPPLYREELEKDSDFDKVRNSEWFKDFLKKLPSEKDVEKI